MSGCEPFSGGRTNGSREAWQYLRGRIVLESEQMVTAGLAGFAEDHRREQALVARNEFTWCRATAGNTAISPK